MKAAEKTQKAAGIWSRFLRVLCGICAGIALVCFGSFLLSQLVQPSETWTKLLALGAVLIVLLPMLLNRLWKRIFPRGLYRFLYGCYVCGLLFFTVTFALLCVRVASYSAEPENIGETVVIVYGCRTRDGEPKTMLAERLDRAYELLIENPVSLCIVSGGVDFGETESEGAIMARYLARKGIYPGRITVEGEAEDTKGNIRYSMALIRENGWENRNIVSVSSSFHMPRIEYLCSRYGLVCDFAGAPTKDFSILLPTLTREYMAYVKMILLNDYT